MFLRGEERVRNDLKTREKRFFFQTEKRVEVFRTHEQWGPLLCSLAASQEVASIRGNDCIVP